MTTLQIILRIVHIVCGVFWVGSAMFLAVFLGPVLRDAGPDGNKIVSALVRRRLAVAVPVAAVVTVLAGLWLYSRNSAGFRPEYMRSGPGMAYGLGALSAITGLIIGAKTIGPTMEKIAHHADSPVPEDPSARDAHVAAAHAMHVRAGNATKIATVFLVLALLAMASARYL